MAATKAAAQKEISLLREEILRHDRLYYAQARPEISDTEYDRLMRRLLELERQYPGLATPDSPTQRVGGFIPSDFAPVHHDPPMLSLDNTYDPQEFRQWHEKVRRFLKTDPGELAVEAKIDGVSLSLRYEDAILKTGATRGDGETGEDVTPNVKTIRAIPLRLPEGAPRMIEVRGEVYMNKRDFAAFNEAEMNAGRDPFANPRNAAAGSLRQKDSKVTARRPLRFFAHSIGGLQGEGPLPFKTHGEFLGYVKELGFSVSEIHRVVQDEKEAVLFYQDLESKRLNLPYEIDGLVVKVNDFKTQNRLGATSKSPRWAIAFKYASTQATTVVKNVIFSVGRTGVTTPVAELEAVACGGVTISSASLHNFSEIARLDLRIGDTVLIERAGEVIPHVVAVVKSKRPKAARPIPPPQACPVCNGKTLQEEEFVAWQCVNPSCPAQLKRGVLHFAGRDAMDIDGMGDAVVDQLVDRGRIKSFADLYALKKEDLLELDLFADKRAENMLSAIAASKTRPLSRLVLALGIRHVGEKMARVLSRRFKTLDAIATAGEEELAQVSDVGPVVANSIRTFFRQKQALALLQQLRSHGVNMTEPDKAGVAARTDRIPLEGKTFVFTGELKSMTRSEAEGKILDLGGEPSASVSKKTSFVVVGKAPGSKSGKARKLGVAILDEAAFLELIRTADGNSDD